MIFADVMIVVFIIIGLLLAFPAYWLLWQALFPGFIRKARLRAERSPLKALALGVPLGVFGFAVSLALLAAPNGLAKILGAAGLIGLFGCAFAGASGLCWLIGERLPSVRDQEQAWRPVLRGGMILELSFLLPFLGWLVLLPLSLMFGLGCWLLAWFPAPAERPRGLPPEIPVEEVRPEYGERLGVSR